jgi:hypothetical protein
MILILQNGCSNILFAAKKINFLGMSCFDFPRHNVIEERATYFQEKSVIISNMPKIRLL